MRSGPCDLVHAIWPAPTMRASREAIAGEPNCRQCSTLGDSQGLGEGGFGRRPESHSGALCCSTYCLITDSGAPPHEMMQYDRDQNAGCDKRVEADCRTLVGPICCWSSSRSTLSA